MDIFLAIHEMAVIGSALFLMAISSLWYSDLLFGKQWLRAVGKSVVDATPDSQLLIRSLTGTFVSYVAILTVLSLMLRYVVTLQIERTVVPTLLLVVYVGFVTNHVIWERRGWWYWCISVGFATIFLYVGTWLIMYWPW